MNKNSIQVSYLYPRQMSLYGDRANAMVLAKRAQWRGLKVTVNEIHPDTPILPHSDIILIGGGQDHDQEMIVSDLLRLKPQISDQIKAGASLLAICGGYQLVGETYETVTSEIEGMGLLPYHTERADIGQARIIGNLICHNAQWGDLWGYENHGGRTYLRNGLQPLGLVRQGGGNNNIDKTEGVLADFGNGLILGTYFHTFLPKNPLIADYLLSRAISSDSQALDALPPLPVDIQQQDRSLAEANRLMGLSLAY